MPAPATVMGLALALACGITTPSLYAGGAPQSRMERKPGAEATVPPEAASQTILVLGDSLSAGYGLAPNTGWVALLQQRLADKPVGKNHYTVVNSSISGDTTSGGRTRLPSALSRTHPAVVIVELGANDALRGLPMSVTRANLEAIIEASQAAGARVVLVGMQIPPNYGPVYTQAFSSLFPMLAKQYHTSLVPFLLEGIADKPEMFQADQIHPLAKAQPVLLENVWAPLSPLLK
ncbi:acyl-CoA thioesterase-1 [Robbsia andropogonis]|uniref:arylesterase n=1 Tax=Robbsia andropogonis TaxID=28092 RepID=UPI00389A646C